MKKVRKRCNDTVFFMNHPFFASACGITLKQYFESPQEMMRAQINTFELTGYKNPLLPDFGVVPVANGLGCKVTWDNIGIPGCEKRKAESLEDLDGLKPADPKADNYMQKALSFLSYMKEHMPDGIQAGPSLLMGPVTVASMIRGTTEFCTDIFDDPDRVKELLDVITETSIAYLNAQEEILGPLKHLVVSDDISSFLNRNQFEEFVVPYYDKLLSHFPHADKILHNDASAAHLAEAIGETDFDYWHVGSCIDILKAREDSRGKITLIGGLDPIREVAGLDQESLCNTVIKRLEEFGEDTRLILSAGGFINYGTPPENIKTVHQVVLEHLRRSKEWETE